MVGLVLISLFFLSSGFATDGRVHHFFWEGLACLFLSVETMVLALYSLVRGQDAVFALDACVSFNVTLFLIHVRTQLVSLHPGKTLRS